MLVTADTHIHSRYSGDSSRRMTIDAICREALKRGLTAVAITDHYELSLELRFDPASREAEIAEAKEKYAGKLTVLRGIELGEQASDFKEANRVLSLADFELVLCSVHAVCGWDDFYDVPYSALTDEELVSLWEKYLAELYETVCFGTMDVMAHIRYPERYYREVGKDGLMRIEEKGKDYYEPIFKKMIERGIALEINTKAPLRKGQMPDPGVELLKFYKELGGRKVTVGSDAHVGRNIGGGFAEAAAMLEAAGLSPVRDVSELRIRR